MTILAPFLSIDSSCDQALQRTMQKLSQAGLLSMQTFNLAMARPGLDGCSCPRHGTDACDCQMVVLLVYGALGEPATVILHGNGGKTWLSLADDTLHRSDSELIPTIQNALAPGECRDR